MCASVCALSCRQHQQSGLSPLMSLSLPILRSPRRGAQGCLQGDQTASVMRQPCQMLLM